LSRQKRALKHLDRLPPLAGPSPPLAARSTLAVPTCPRGRRGLSDAQPSCRSPGFGEPRVLEDQFQRNGVILDSAFPVFGMATPVLSVGEELGGFTGIFEIVAADKARVGRVKRRPFCAGNVDWRPYHPSPPLLPQSTLASLPDPGGELRQGTLPQQFGRPTDDPTGDDTARRSRTSGAAMGAATSRTLLWRAPQARPVLPRSLQMQRALRGLATGMRPIRAPRHDPRWRRG
jgi:hypothetical protein